MNHSGESGACSNTNVWNDQAFAQWARSYDARPNPFLALEERYLKQMLPQMSNLDVLDAGCGSGRWLSYIADFGPRTLKGIDASDEMLQLAASRNIRGVELFHGRCDSTLFADRSFDVILSSFVFGYIGDIGSAAMELDRVSRAGCNLFISDMHPETQQLLGWKRAFRGDVGEVVLDTAKHNLQKLIYTFRSLGWEIRAVVEVEFGSAEKEIFSAADRLNNFEEAKNSPAIYILHFEKTRTPARPTVSEPGIRIRRARCSLGPRESTFASLRVADRQIQNIVAEPYVTTSIPAGDIELDLSGYLLLPGLINAHDHLEFALFPRLANPPYNNATEWAEDIHNRFSDTIARHRSVPLEVRLWWGGLRNLLSGVTTVCHHNPITPELLRPDFPVRVVRKFGWEHSLKFGGDVRSSHAATPPGCTFIVHACEGIDEAAWQEIFELDECGVLDARTVLVHGLALDVHGAALMQQRNASLVICPSSNRFLFGKTPDSDVLRNISKLALASDSPLTARGDLLDEIRFATCACNLSSSDCYRMVTDSADSILRLGNSVGTMRVGCAGDAIAVRDTYRGPAETLASISYRDVEFVMIAGRVQLASNTVYKRLPQTETGGLEPLWVDGTLRWLRAPVKELLRNAEEVLGQGIVRLGGKPICIHDSFEVNRDL